MPQPLITLTGSTGTVGGLVAERLAEQGANLRLVVRNPAGAPKIAGVDLATASDYSATDEMKTALEGTDTLFFVSGRESEDRLEGHYSLIDAAVAAGVSRVVYTSFCGAAPNATFTLARDHYATEQAIRQSGMGFVFQRQNLYADLLPLLAGTDGIIRGPAGDGRFAPVTRSDVADVAVRLLTDDSRDGEIFNITGPERVSLRHVEPTDRADRQALRVSAGVRRRRLRLPCPLRRARLAGCGLGVDLSRDRRRRARHRHGVDQESDRPRPGVIRALRCRAPGELVARRARGSLTQGRPAQPA